MSEFPQPKKQIIVISTSPPQPSSERGARPRRFCSLPTDNIRSSTLMCSICLNTRCEKCLQPTDSAGRHFPPGNPLRYPATCQSCKLNSEVTYRCSGSNSRVEVKNNATQDSRHHLLETTSESKNVQTSSTDIGKLELLKLVLQLDEKNLERSEIIEVKTPEQKEVRSKTSNLVVANVCNMSLGNSTSIFADNESKCVVIDSRASEKINEKKSFDILLNSKSFSIPQMKLDELKNSLKEKNKAKDTIDEVNRMFANVGKKDSLDLNPDCNRPSLRIGPRILPVVKPPIVLDAAANDKPVKDTFPTAYKDFLDDRRKKTTENNLQGAKSNIEQKKCIYTMSFGNKDAKEECRGIQGDYDKLDKCNHHRCKHQRTSRSSYFSNSNDDSGSDNTSSTFF